MQIDRPKLFFVLTNIWRQRIVYQVNRVFGNSTESVKIKMPGKTGHYYKILLDYFFEAFSSVLVIFSVSSSLSN